MDEGKQHEKINNPVHCGVYCIAGIVHQGKFHHKAFTVSGKKIHHALEFIMGATPYLLLFFFVFVGFFLK